MRKSKMTSLRRTSACRRLFPEKTDNDDSGNTARDLLMHEVKIVCDRWNLDPKTGLPRPGPYDWQRVEITGPKSTKGKEDEEAELQDDKDKGRQVDGPGVRASCLDAKERGTFTNDSSTRSTTSSQLIPTPTKEVDSHAVAASLETAPVDSDIFATSLPVSSRNTAKSLDFASRYRPTDATAERSESSAPTGACSSHNCAKEYKASVVSSLSMTTTVDELLFSEIPRTSGTPTDDCIETEETRHCQMAIKDYFPCKKFKTSRKTSRISNGEDDDISSAGDHAAL